MQVNAVEPQGTPAFRPQITEQTQPETPQESTDIDETSQIEPDVEDEGAGVLRLLQEGHFKGVSDVRLRINFFEQLAALEQSQLQSTSGENIGTVQDAVDSPIDDLLEPTDPANDLTEEQKAEIEESRQTFDDAVNGQTDGILSTANLIEGLQSAFNDLVGALQTTLGITTTPANQPPPDISADTEENAANETPDEPNFYEQFIDDLTSAFNSAVQNLQASFESVTVLPELSEPNGNGVAYEKFLAIYNDMLGIEPTAQHQTPTESLDSTG